jgi:hypothetical protein
MTDKAKNKYFFIILSVMIIFSVYLLYQRVFIREDFIIQEE